MKLALVAALFASLLPATALACEPYYADQWAPDGTQGCELTGTESGKASVWPGPVAAAQWCVYPWTGCMSVRVQSHVTGLTIVVTPAQFCHCYWMTDRRLIDLTFGQVRALGLDPADGLFAVTVTPLGDVTQVASVLPDTAYNERAEVAAESHTVNSRGPSGVLPHIGRALRVTGGSS